MRQRCRVWILIAQNGHLLNHRPNPPKRRKSPNRIECEVITCRQVIMNQTAQSAIWTMGSIITFGKMRKVQTSDGQNVLLKIAFSPKWGIAKLKRNCIGWRKHKNALIWQCFRVSTEGKCLQKQKDVFSTDTCKHFPPNTLKSVDFKAFFAVYSVFLHFQIVWIQEN